MIYTVIYGIAAMLLLRAGLRCMAQCPAMREGKRGKAKGARGLNHSAWTGGIDPL